MASRPLIYRLHGRTEEFGADIVAAVRARHALGPEARLEWSSNDGKDWWPILDPATMGTEEAA